MRKNKYNAVKTVINGITFDSKKEARRYGELKLLEKAGKITSIQPHPPFFLKINDIKLGNYILDFMYYDEGAEQWIYEDVKAWDKKAKKGKGDWLVTPMSRWKKKHVEAQYGITVDYV